MKLNQQETKKAVSELKMIYQKLDQMITNYSLAIEIGSDNARHLLGLLKLSTHNVGRGKELLETVTKEKDNA